MALLGLTTLESCVSGEKGRYRKVKDKCGLVGGTDEDVKWNIELKWKRRGHGWLRGTRHGVFPTKKKQSSRRKHQNTMEFATIAYMRAWKHVRMKREGYKKGRHDTEIQFQIQFQIQMRGLQMDFTDNSEHYIQSSSKRAAPKQSDRPSVTCTGLI